jgi:hypothetical protein
MIEEFFTVFTEYSLLFLYMLVIIAGVVKISLLLLKFIFRDSRDASNIIIGYYHYLNKDKNK